MNRLNKKEWYVNPISHKQARDLILGYHYTKSVSNTGTYIHGLFYLKDCWLDAPCYGVALWLPPTNRAAAATFPENWQGVLSLSRLVIVPNVPANAATFLLSQSRKLIDRERWPCLVTYADTAEGHTGQIYKADNWQYIGLTTPSERWSIEGRLISRKAGPKTRTYAEMLALGARFEGRHAKHKFVRIRR